MAHTIAEDVGQPHTLSDVTSTPRQRITVSVSGTGLDRLKTDADREAEGNLSLMVRKLLAEAYQTRDARNGSRP
jgi:hypothetical protein